MLKYVTGDLFSHPIDPNKKTYICHIVNDLGAWGSGFVIPLGKKYPKSMEQYLNHYNNYKLGDCQVVNVNKEPETSIVNMFAQKGISNYKNKQYYKPFQYGYFASCLLYLTQITHTDDNILMPLVGAGLGGGNWDIIEEIIDNLLGNYDVTIFQLPGQEVRCTTN